MFLCDDYKCAFAIFIFLGFVLFANCLATIYYYRFQHDISFAIMIVN